jgi:hypothetical protein
MRPRSSALGALALLLAAPAAASLASPPGTDGPVALPCGDAPQLCGLLQVVCARLPEAVSSLVCPEPPPPGFVDIVGESLCTPDTCFFQPESLTVQVGATVTWTNTANMTPHTATSDDPLFDSGSLQPGDEFSFTFFSPGTFAYHCDVHGGFMGTGTVVVEA